MIGVRVLACLMGNHLISDDVFNHNAAANIE
jgi:hypothetical protein